jgi:penicillin-binding protein 2
VVRPRLLLRSQDPDGRVTEGPAAEIVSTVPVSPANLALVRKALIGVVEEPRGTGGRSRVPGMIVAGKTGTAQVVHLQHTRDLEEDEIPMKYRDHAWFIAFAPADAPRIVVAVLNEHGGHGGSAAAPIAQRVLARWAEKHLPAAQVAEGTTEPAVQVAEGTTESAAQVAEATTEAPHVGN